MHTVYILRSLANQRHYVDCTQDLIRRLRQHNNNETRSLKNRGPFEVIYTEELPTLTEARKRELQIKRYKGGEAFKKLINCSTSGAVV